jgi:putative peptidoglycan lipid II flippase
MASANLVVNTAVSLALYKPYGIAGLVIGTAVASAGMTITQTIALRRTLHGRLEGRRTVAAVAAIAAASLLLGVISYAVWAVLDAIFGRGLIGEIISVGGAGAAGTAAFAYSVLWMELPEARQIRGLIRERVGR